ncbi:DUF3325 domain-containing protein [Duganella aquatilis]|nr:DUF3325 domain-containing protein [Duganella aquatilis]
MMNILGMVAALASAVGGFTALSLAMDRHWEALHGRGNLPTGRTRRTLRRSGAAGLLVSLLVCLDVWGGSQGWVAWAGMLTAAAIGMVLVLTYAARAMVRVGWIAGGLGAAAVVLAQIARGLA